MGRLNARYPHKIGIYIGYIEPLAHNMYAASDLFMILSLFEPCGVSLIIAQIYATEQLSEE